MSIQFRELDVRSILRDGGEPFQAIMSAVAALAQGEGLRLIAPFRPQPLFSVMEGKGFGHEVIELGGGDVEVRFTPVAAKLMASDNLAEPDAWPDPRVEIDVSDLDPPLPMVRILAKLEELRPGEVLFAVLAREPVFLFPELIRRGHQWVGNYDREGVAFRIMIRRGADA
jgi:uncharacterized protein (DUF2249 family)